MKTGTIALFALLITLGATLARADERGLELPAAAVKPVDFDAVIYERRWREGTVERVSVSKDGTAWVQRRVGVNAVEEVRGKVSKDSLETLRRKLGEARLRDLPARLKYDGAPHEYYLVEVSYGITRGSTSHRVTGDPAAFAPYMRRIDGLDVSLDVVLKTLRPEQPAARTPKAPPSGAKGLTGSLTEGR